MLTGESPKFSKIQDIFLKKIGCHFVIRKIENL